MSYTGTVSLTCSLWSLRSDAKLLSRTVTDSIVPLQEKRQELEEEQNHLQERLAEIDEKLDTLDGAIKILREDSVEDQGEQQTSARRLSDWPEEASMPKRVLHVFKQVGHVMQPSEMDDYIRTNSAEGIRDNAVAETMSRLARQERLRRKDYGSTSYFYGLPDWWYDGKEDFDDEVKPKLSMLDKT